MRGRARPAYRRGRSGDRGGARRQRQRRAPHPRRAAAAAERPRARGLSPEPRAQPEPERRPGRGAAGRARHLARAAEEGIDWIRKAMRSTRSTRRASGITSRALFGARATPKRPTRSRASPLRRVPPRFPRRVPRHGGRHGARLAQAQASLKRKPDFSVARNYLPTLHYKRESDLVHHREALLKAGLPA